MVKKAAATSPATPGPATSGPATPTPAASSPAPASPTPAAAAAPTPSAGGPRADRTERPASGGTSHRPARPARPEDLIADTDGPAVPIAAAADSDEQIERQRLASRQDAEQLATARYAAAMKALTKFASEVEEELGADGDDEDTPTEGPAPTPPAPSAASPTTANPAAASPTTASPPPAPAEPLFDPITPSAPILDRTPPPLLENPVLLELRMSPLGADIDHIGDRLLIRSDRIELRDRADTIRRWTAMADVERVAVQKKLTGASLVIESSTAGQILAKGVRPDLAEEAHLLISRLAPPPIEPVPPTPPVRRIDEKDLARKLTDLYQAGVLTTMEYEEKKELIARLARAEQFTQVR